MRSGDADQIQRHLSAVYDTSVIYRSAEYILAKMTCFTCSIVVIRICNCNGIISNVILVTFSYVTTEVIMEISPIGT